MLGLFPLASSVCINLLCHHISGLVICLGLPFKFALWLFVDMK
jgi:hypothetical protein